MDSRFAGTTRSARAGEELGQLRRNDEFAWNWLMNPPSNFVFERAANRFNFWNGGS